MRVSVLQVGRTYKEGRDETTGQETFDERGELARCSASINDSSSNFGRLILCEFLFL